jgi:hypothetical protein
MRLRQVKPSPRSPLLTGCGGPQWTLDRAGADFWFVHADYPAGEIRRVPPA